MSDKPTPPTANTVIWSGEHRAYWRPKEHGYVTGYTTNVEQAGIWSYAEAERMTRHCGPEKQIQLRLKHETPECIARSQPLPPDLDRALCACVEMQSTQNTSTITKEERKAIAILITVAGLALEKQIVGLPGSVVQAVEIANRLLYRARGQGK